MNLVGGLAAALVSLLAASAQALTDGLQAPQVPEIDLVLNEVCAETVPQAEEWFALLQLDMHRMGGGWGTGGLETLDSSLFWRSSAQDKRVRLIDQGTFLSATRSDLLVSPSDWPPPSEDKFETFEVPLCNGAVKVQLYFDEQHRLIWKTADVQSAVGEVRPRASNDMRKRALRWALEVVFDSRSTDAYLARRIINRLALQECTTALSQTERASVLAKLKAWAYSDDATNYSELLLAATPGIKAALVENPLHPATSERAEIMRRIEGCARYAFLSVRKPPKSKPAGVTK